MKFVYPLDLVPFRDQLFIPEEGSVPAHYETVTNVNKPDDQVVIHTAGNRLEHVDPGLKVQAQEVPGYAPAEEASDG